MSSIEALVHSLVLDYKYDNIEYNTTQYIYNIGLYSKFIVTSIHCTCTSVNSVVEHYGIRYSGNSMFVVTIKHDTHL